MWKPNQNKQMTMDESIAMHEQALASLRSQFEAASNALDNYKRKLVADAIADARRDSEAKTPIEFQYGNRVPMANIVSINGQDPELKKLEEKYQFLASEVDRIENKLKMLRRLAVK